MKTGREVQVEKMEKKKKNLKSRYSIRSYMNIDGDG